MSGPGRSWGGAGGSGPGERWRADWPGLGLWSVAVLNGRIYRAAFIPFVIALAIAGFSLRAPAAPLTSTLAPDAFNGALAFAELKAFAASYPRRRPGSQGDDELAAYVARTLQSLGGSTAGGFSVHTTYTRSATIDGQRTLASVIARRPGLTGDSPIVLLAHRDAAGRGAPAELSGTAVLIELARVLAASETQRTVIVVSTSGGSGGDGGAAGYAASYGGEPVDGAIVLGDLAGAGAHKPFVLPYSDGLGSAPGVLLSTVSAAVEQVLGVSPEAPSTLSQFAHLVLPLSAGEEGTLIARGIPAVLVQVSGERPPRAGEPISAARLENFGRAVLSAVYALDAGANVGSQGQGQGQGGGGGDGGLETAVPIQQKLLPAWAVELLVATLLLPPLGVLIDGFARARRRRLALGPRLLWTLACALPFLVAALFTRLLGLTGVLAAPAGIVLAAGLPGGVVALETVLAPVLVLVLAWLAWPATVRRLGLRPRAEDDASGLALSIVLLCVTLVVFVFNPFTALLLVPALHLWLLLASPELRDSGQPAHRLGLLALVALGLVPLVLLAAFYARQLALDPGAFLHAAVLLFAGGFFGVPALVLWCLAFGCLAAATLVAVGSSGAASSQFADPDEGGEGVPITVRGPLSYAGPGSLGGTESALRR